MPALHRVRLACTLLAFLCPFEMVAQQPPTVTGLVLDASDRPIGDVLVFVGDGIQSSLTDPSGVFHLAAITRGSHVLSYRKAGYAPRSFSLVLRDGEARDVGSVTLQVGADPAAALRGLVTERIGGNPLQGATVELNGDIIAAADATGAFDISRVPVRWGRNQLRVRHSSFADAEVQDEFWVTNLDEAFEFAVVLDVAPINLPGVSVETVRPVPAKLRGFYERMENGSGIFLERDDIEARIPRRISDLLMTFRSTSRTRAASTFGRAATRDCVAPLIFLDGHLIGNEFNRVFVDGYAHPNVNDFVHPDDVEAIEIYDAVASVPSVFAQTGSGCGVIAIWTR